eukprot:scaffold1064_cov85-Amphora_coffeaeformis.AAC.20
MIARHPSHRNGLTSCSNTPSTISSTTTSSSSTMDPRIGDGPRRGVTSTRRQPMACRPHSRAPPSPLHLLAVVVVLGCSCFSSSSMTCQAFTPTSRYNNNNNNNNRDRIIAASVPLFGPVGTTSTTQLSLLPSSSRSSSSPSSSRWTTTRPLLGRIHNPGRSTTRTTTSTALQLAQKSDDQDAREYKAVLTAFKLYKAAYGDLKIPQRFVVPSMKPWPKPAWGMRLGKIVMHMRSTGKYTDNHPERKQELDDLGFLWQVRPAAAPKQVTLTQVYTALDTYQRLNGGSTAVPLNFVVPNAPEWPESVRELPLGKSLVSLSKQLDKKADQKWKDRFATLGWPEGTAVTGSSGTNELPAAVAPFREEAPPAPAPVPSAAAAAADAPKNLSANEERFWRVYVGLETYKAIYGDLLVPQPFTVPDKDPQWPEDTWGLRLGARVNAIRSQGTFINGNPERRQMLDDLGFVWSPPKANRSERKKTAAENVTTKKAEASEDASSDDNFSDLFGAEFGFMNNMGGGDKGDAAAAKPSWAFEGGGDLQDLAKQPPEENKEDEYLPARSLQESLDEAVERAKDVGIIEGLTSSRRVIKGKQEKNIPWFNDDFGDDFVFEDVVEALTVYKSFYGDFSNLTQAEDFVIPSRVEPTGFLDDDDDDALATFDIDASARAARAIAKYEEEGDTDRSKDLIAAEIERLKKEVGLLTEEESETKEEVPKLDDKKGEWPEHLTGMKLGNIVARIRDGSLEVKHIPERKKQLDKIKFDWGDDLKFVDVPFEKAMCAMYAYYMIRGDLFVYEDFVMPDEDPWPQALAGYEIGKAVKRLRELQNFLEAFHPEKVSLLRMIDFVWFPTTALPIDPDEPEMDDELLRLSALGHPDYAKMIDIPMGLPDRIIADGPFYESDNPKHWWRIWHNWDYVKDYWYQQGRRDNAFVLRNMGYPKMGDEHEAKYGPGLFKLIEGTLSTIEAGIDGKTVEEKKEILSKLSYYRQEMLDCTDVHPEERDKLLDQFDEHMREIMKDSNIDFVIGEDDVYEEAEEDDAEEEDYEYEDYEYEEEEGEEEGEEEEVEEFDVEDELGLDSR